MRCPFVYKMFCFYEFCLPTFCCVFRFFVFSVVLLDDISVFFDGPFKKSLIQFILAKPLGGNHARFWPFAWMHATMRMKYSLCRMFLRLVAWPLMEFSYVQIQGLRETTACFDT